MKGVIAGVFIKFLTTMAGLHLFEKFKRDAKKERGVYLILKHCGIKLKKVFIAS